MNRRDKWLDKIIVSNAAVALFALLTPNDTSWHNWVCCIAIGAGSYSLLCFVEALVDDVIRSRLPPAHG